MRVLLFLLSACLLAAATAPPQVGGRQTSRKAILARAARRRQLAAMGIHPRQAAASCPVYPTCSPSYRTGSNYCQLPQYDMLDNNDISGINAYSHEDCVTKCESNQGCAAVVWVPSYTDIDRARRNCFFKTSSYTSSSFTTSNTAAQSAGTVTTLLGDCCSVNAKIPSAAKSIACNDDGQSFVFPTCTGSRDLNTGSAVYSGVGLRTNANQDGYRTTAYTGVDGFGTTTLKARSLGTCLGACDSFANQCKGAVFIPGSTSGNDLSCYFKGSAYINATTGPNAGGGNGYRNASNAEFVLRDTNCQDQVGKVPDVVSFYCCNDPVNAYPTCATSTGDGSAFYPNWDNNDNSLRAYGSDNSDAARDVASAAACNSLCFQQIGSACLGTTFTGPPGTRSGFNCYFKTSNVLSSTTVRNNFNRGPTAGLYLIGGCSQYSNVVPSAANSECCVNR